MTALDPRAQHFDLMYEQASRCWGRLLLLWQAAAAAACLADQLQHAALLRPGGSQPLAVGARQPRKPDRSSC